LKRSSGAIATFTLALAAVSLPAYANEWFVVNYHAHTCEISTKHLAPTPLAFEEKARAEGFFPATEVKRDNQNNIIAIFESVTKNGQELGTIYFATEKYCEQGLKSIGASNELN
jgi:hypothetical protein